MSKTVVSEGKTRQEAIDKGLKELRVSKDKVIIKDVENEEKRSFYSILTPRVVKVELTLKEDAQTQRRETRAPRKPERRDAKLEIIDILQQIKIEETEISIDDLITIIQKIKTEYPITKINSAQGMGKAS